MVLVYKSTLNVSPREFRNLNIEYDVWEKTLDNYESDECFLIVYGNKWANEI